MATEYTLNEGIRDPAGARKALERINFAGIKNKGLQTRLSFYLAYDPQEGCHTNVTSIHTDVPRVENIEEGKWIVPQHSYQIDTNIGATDLPRDQALELIVSGLIRPAFIEYHMHATNSESYARLNALIYGVLPRVFALGLKGINPRHEKVMWLYVGKEIIPDGENENLEQTQVLSVDNKGLTLLRSVVDNKKVFDTEELEALLSMQFDPKPTAGQMPAYTASLPTLRGTGKD